jgi:hypothetical protein
VTTQSGVLSPSDQGSQSGARAQRLRGTLHRTRRATGAWWLTPLAIYAVTRLLSALMVVLAAPQRVHSIGGASHQLSGVTGHLPPTYLDVLTSWDGQWYWSIVRDGYAASALDAAGHPVQTNLAFLPLYPQTVHVLMRLTGGDFALVATTSSLVLGALAIVCVYGLVAECVDGRRARGCVVLLCCFASAPILQSAYTESMALLFVAGALWLLHRRQYLWCAVPTLLLGATRNIAPALLVVIVVHWALRIRESRAAEPSDGPPVPHVRLAVLAACGVIAVLTWPVLSALLTGEPSAYFTTMKAWPGITGSILVPSWAHAAAQYTGLAFLVGLTVIGLWLATRLLPGRRRWGVELTMWAVAYPAYIFATTIPSFSLARYLLLAFPLGLLWLPDTTSERQLRRQRVALVAFSAFGLFAQWLWISKLMVYGGPHGGWGFP